jgi:hypothetical protein
MEQKKELSFGERLVGVTFNPSQNEKVERVKKLCAELADIVHEESNKESFDSISTIVSYSALNHIKDASMNAVKLITLP